MRRLARALAVRTHILDVDKDSDQTLERRWKHQLRSLKEASAAHSISTKISRAGPYRAKSGNFGHKVNSDSDLVCFIL